MAMALQPEPRDVITIPAIGDDGGLFPIEKIAAHRAGVLHQAVSIFVFSGPLLLVQRRAAGKYHCGGLWANTCCSHPHWGESLDACAQRRLGEELGLSLPLSRAATIQYSADVGGGLRENERVTVYHGRIRKAAAVVRADSDEVAETRWMTVRRLKIEACMEPAAFAPWFRIYLARWAELGL